MSHTEDSRRRDRDDSRALPHGAKPIDVDDDYFLRQEEFRIWLKQEKSKYVDELSSEKSRSYFRKFAKAWNSGKLSDSLYDGVNSTSRTSSSNTAYRWAFAEKGTAKDRAAMESARDSVGAATYRQSALDRRGHSPPARHRVAGPSLPSAGDWALHQEEHREDEQRRRNATRKRERDEDRERVEDAVGPKESGREGMLEKKRMKRENDREARDARDGAGLEVGEDVLMGGGDSFQARIAQRDAARRRFEEKKQASRMDRSSETQERLLAMREKEKATMAHFQALAKERFG